MCASFAFLPQFLQTPPPAGYGFGSSVTESGLVMLVQAGTAFVVGLVTGPLIARFGSRTVLMGGGCSFAAGYLLLAVAYEHVWQPVLAALLNGVGFGSSFAAMAILVVAAGADRRGQRDERQHPHRRRRDRLGADVHRGHRLRRAGRE